MDESTPRVNSRLLSNYVGKNVILIAETGQGTDQVVASDGGIVNVVLPPGESFETKYVQILGKLNQQRQFETIRIQPAGNNFSMENYNKAVELMNDKFSSIF